MKKLLLFLGVFVMTVSCDKDDDAAVSWAPIETILSGHYWDEKLYFIYEENGETHLSADLLTAFTELPLTGVSLDLEIMLSPPYEANAKVINPIYVEREISHKSKTWLRTYFYWEEEGRWFYDSIYSIDYDPDNRFIKLNTRYTDNLLKNAVAGLEMRIVSATSDQVVFEVPLKEYVRYEYFLEEFKLEDLEYYKPPKRHYRGLRIVWTISDFESLLDASVVNRGY